MCRALREFAGHGPAWRGLAWRRNLCLVTRYAGLGPSIGRASLSLSAARGPVVTKRSRFSQREGLILKIPEYTYTTTDPRWPQGFVLAPHICHDNALIRGDRDAAVCALRTHRRTPCGQRAGVAVERDDQKKSAK